MAVRMPSLRQWGVACVAWGVLALAVLPWRLSLTIRTLIFCLVAAFATLLFAPRLISAAIGLFAKHVLKLTVSITNPDLNGHVQEVFVEGAKLGRVCIQQLGISLSQDWTACISCGAVSVSRPRPPADAPPTAPPSKTKPQKFPSAIVRSLAQRLSVAIEHLSINTPIGHDLDLQIVASKGIKFSHPTTRGSWQLDVEHLEARAVRTGSELATADAAASIDGSFQVIVGWYRGKVDRLSGTLSSLCASADLDALRPLLAAPQGLVTDDAPAGKPPPEKQNAGGVGALRELPRNIDFSLKDVELRLFAAHSGRQDALHMSLGNAEVSSLRDTDNNKVTVALQTGNAAAHNSIRQFASLGDAKLRAVLGLGRDGHVNSADVECSIASAHVGASYGGGPGDLLAWMPHLQTARPTAEPAADPPQPKALKRLRALSQSKRTGSALFLQGLTSSSGWSLKGDIKLNDWSATLYDGSSASVDSDSLLFVGFQSVALTCDRGPTSHSTLGVQAELTGMFGIAGQAAGDTLGTPEEVQSAVASHAPGRFLFLDRNHFHAVYDARAALATVPGLSLDASLHALRVEWSSEVSHLLTRAAHKLPLDAISRVRPAKPKERAPQQQQSQRPLVELSIKGELSCLCLVVVDSLTNTDCHGVMLSVGGLSGSFEGDEGSLQGNMPRTRVSTIGCASLLQCTTEQLSVESEADLCTVQGCTLSVTKPHSGRAQVRLQVEDVALAWTLETHVQAYEAAAPNLKLVLSAKEHFASRQSSLLSLARADNQHGLLQPEPMHFQSHPTQPRTQMGAQLAVKRVHTHITMPGATVCEVVADECVAHIVDGDTSLHLDSGAFVVDDRKLVSFSSLLIDNQASLAAQLAAAFDGAPDQNPSFSSINLQGNNQTLWLLQFDSISIKHPFGFDFGARLENIKTWIRTIKTIHPKAKKPRTGDMAPHVGLRVGSLNISFEDDPFEVRLSLNNDLRADEFLEQQDRERVLEAKMTSLRDSAPEKLSDDSVGKLYASLEQKNDQIFCKRARELHLNTPSQRDLFRVSATNFTIVAFADPDLSTDNGLCAALARINPQSPMPDNLLFDLLLGRKVHASWDILELNLREFPRRLVSMQHCTLHGTLVIAEPDALETAKRAETVSYRRGQIQIVKSTTPIKFFHDFKLAGQCLDVNYGPSFDGTIQQLGLSIDLISKPSVDPSPALPWFDKARLMRHGPLAAAFEQFSVCWMAGSDPQSKSDCLEMQGQNLGVEWCLSRVTATADEVIFRSLTPSKYSGCPVMQMPSLSVECQMQWKTKGDFNDHHSVQLWAPDKVRNTSAHDSFGMFRSECVGLDFAITVPPVAAEVDGDGDGAGNASSCVLLYSKTLRFLKHLDASFSVVPRPVRKGSLYQDTPGPKKISLGQHFSTVRFTANMPSLTLVYFDSYERRNGLLATAVDVQFSSVYNNVLLPTPAGPKLVQRPRREWTPSLSEGSLRNLRVRVLTAPTTSPLYAENAALKRDFLITDVHRVLSDVEAGKSTLLVKDWLESAAVVYTLLCAKAKKVAQPEPPARRKRPQSVKTQLAQPSHKFRIAGLRFIWTPETRTIVARIWGTYADSRALKFDLSPDALSHARAQEPRARDDLLQPVWSPSRPGGTALLEQLVADKELNFVAKDEEADPSQMSIPGSQIVRQRLSDDLDVLSTDFIIEFDFVQAGFRGLETDMPITTTAERAVVSYRTHQPVWRRGQLDTKQSWVGSFESLQYFAAAEGQDVFWLEQEWTQDVQHLPEGIVRLVSPCKSTFSYNSFAPDIEKTAKFNGDPSIRRHSDTLLLSGTHLVDAVTVVFEELHLNTSSAQWAALNDIIGNVLFATDSAEQDSIDRLETLKYKAQLQQRSNSDRTASISALQTTVRTLLRRSDELERRIIELAEQEFQQKSNDSASASADEAGGPTSPTPLLLGEASLQLESIESERLQLEEEWGRNKRLLRTSRRDLHLLVQSMRETSLDLSESAHASKDVENMFSTHVLMTNSKWSLARDNSHARGISIEANFSEVSYDRMSHINGSGESRFEVGDAVVTNHLDDAKYPTVLCRYEAASQAFDRGVMIRIYARDKPPVGGIPVKEHFEVNTVPLTVQLSHRLFLLLMAFFFPETDAAALDRRTSDMSMLSSVSSDSDQSRTKRGMFPPLPEAGQNTDVDEMKARALKNRTFLYVKMTRVLVCVSYKGPNAKKNIEDLNSFVLTLPMFECRSKTCTWKDIVDEYKSFCTRNVLGQALKHKIKAGFGRDSSQQSPGKGSAPPPQDNGAAKAHREAFVGGMSSPSSERKKRSNPLAKMFSSKKRQLPAAPRQLPSPRGATPSSSSAPSPPAEAVVAVPDLAETFNELSSVEDAALPNLKN